MRTADGAGADGVILTERRAAPVNATVAKASAGATEHVRIAKVTNLVRSLEKLKANNVWCIGLDERGEKSYDEFDFKADCVLVLGREGEGLHDLTRKTCDHLLRIPMAGGVASLNVSVAGAVVMYEKPHGSVAMQPRSPRRPRRMNLIQQSRAKGWAPDETSSLDCAVCCLCSGLCPGCSRARISAADAWHGHLLTQRQFTRPICNSG